MGLREKLLLLFVCCKDAKFISFFSCVPENCKNGYHSANVTFPNWILTQFDDAQTTVAKVDAKPFRPFYDRLRCALIVKYKLKYTQKKFRHMIMPWNWIFLGKLILAWCIYSPCKTKMTKWRKKFEFYNTESPKIVLKTNNFN